MEDLENIKAVDLKGRIEEMIRIKVSVSDELRDLESRRQKLQVSCLFIIEINFFFIRLGI